MLLTATTPIELRKQVRVHYAKTAEGAGCCGDGWDCGNPLAVADLHEGDIVLDLGSGGGLEVIQSAKRVGPAGQAYGLDVTHEMLGRARRNAASADVGNATFLKGLIEEIPLPGNSVDGRDLELRPGHRIEISDIVADDQLAPDERAARGSYVGCIAGALSKSEYEDGLRAAGFRDVSVEFTHRGADEMQSAIVKGVKA